MNAMQSLMHTSIDMIIFIGFISLITLTKLCVLALKRSSFWILIYICIVSKLHSKLKLASDLSEGL